MPRRAFISLVLEVSGNVNADAGVGVRIPMKKVVSWNKEIRAFVSPRCIRRAIRNRLAEKGLEIDPLTIAKGQSAEKGQLTDIGDPIRYADDDLFGYLAPVKGKGEIQPARSSAVKVSPLIALHHTEINVEFAGRFPRTDISSEAPEANPVPFEIETAQWLGGMHVIISENVGKFKEDELPSSVLEKIRNREYSNVSSAEKTIELNPEERKRRLKALLEILIKEGWNFPRGSEATSQPKYHYAIVVLSESFVPMPNILRMDEELKLDMSSVEEALRIYNWDKAYLIDYREGKMYSLSKEKPKEEKKMTEGSLDDIVNAVVGFLLPTK